MSLKQSDFVHLHVHSDYSLLDGMAKVGPLTKKAKECGQAALALTDHGTVAGSMAFYKACKKNGIKPILGCEIYLTEDMKKRKRGYNHLTVLAKNQTGWKNLSRISSLANLEGFYYKPRVDFETLAEYSEGLIVLSGCLKGPVPVLLQQEKYDEARDSAMRFKDVFGDDFFLEIQPNSLEQQVVVNDGCLKLARDLEIPTVATCDLHYIEPDDAPAQEVKICIKSGKTLSDDKRLKMKEDFFFHSSEQMISAFRHCPEAILSSREIADRVEDYDLLPGERNEYYLPNFATPDGSETETYFDTTCETGLRRRYGEPTSDQRERLDYEKDVIRKLGFTTYFLIVADFIDWARKNGCPVGPGRGSAAGSIVAYALGITDIDPLRYDLLFERFLNPSRVSMPDIDVDFCEANRGRVIEYVREKYGTENVCQIITFGTLKPKAVIKDVGRVLEIPYSNVEKISKMIPDGPKLKSLQQAYTENPELGSLREDPAYRKLFDMAERLEGINRHEGKHAAGVVISDMDLVERIPLTLVKGDKTTQFTMMEVEEAGLLKMDFLGLRTLTLIEDALKLLRKRGVEVDMDNLPLDDTKAFEMLSRGDSRGVFQLESSGFRKLLKGAKPDRFEDIIALIALYRPGPLGSDMDKAYINRKHGREPVTYLTDLLAPILDETYGCILYQEQVMRIANVIAGLSMADADNLRKAMGKKKLELMNRYKPQFIEGFVAKGVKAEIAEEVWTQIAFFAEYGFNKCLVASTEIMDAETGEVTTVGDLYANRRPFTVHALGDDWKLQPRRVVDVMHNGEKPVFELRTQQGRRIVATGNHPFRTLDGWTNLEDLSVGDRVAASRDLSVETERSWPKHELITLAGLLSEGDTCHPSCLYYFSNEKTLIDDFAAAAEQFEESVARVSTRSDGVRMEVCVSSGQSGHKPWNYGMQGGVATQPRTLRRSGAFLWAERLGILERKATQKQVPSEVFELCDADLELFLGRMWAGDGFIANATQAVPFYATSSRELAKGVQTLLLRLGIFSGLHEKEFRYRDGVRDGFTVHLLGAGSRETFARRVLPHCVGRDGAAALLRQSLASIEPGRTSKDTIPADVRAWVNEERQGQGLTWTEVQDRSGVCVKEFYGKGSPRKLGFRRATVQTLASFFASERLRALAESDVFWDRVVSIEERGVEETFDLTVEHDHNFVADGLIVHNSHSAAYGMVTYRTAYLKAHYPAEFMAATLTSWLSDTDRILDYAADCDHMGIELQPPDVNQSDVKFDVRDEKIIYGLAAIKGLGEGAAAEIVAARQRLEEKGESFRSIFHFCEEVDTRLLNKSALESLVKGGAFDSLGAARSQLAVVVEQAMQMGVQAQKDRLSQQTSLFGGTPTSGPDIATIEADLLPKIKEWSDADLLAYEKEALGYYLTKHPLDNFKEVIERYTSAKIGKLSEQGMKADVTIGGLITNVRHHMTAKGKQMAFVTLEDFSGTCDVVVFPSVYMDVRNQLLTDTVVFVQGKVDTDREPPSVLVDKMLSVEEAQGALRVSVSAELVLEETTQEMIAKLRELFIQHRGEDLVYYTFLRQHDNQKAGPFRVGGHLKVKGNDALRGAMLEVLGPSTRVHIGARL